MIRETGSLSILSAVHPRNPNNHQDQGLDFGNIPWQQACGLLTVTTEFPSGSIAFTGNLATPIARTYIQLNLLLLGRRDSPALPDTGRVHRTLSPLITDGNRLLSNNKDRVSGDQKLGYDDVINALREDHLISPQQLAKLGFIADESNQAPIHPLVLIAEQNLTSATSPEFKLNLERLTRWLAERTKIDYIKIDPLKIDVSAVTNVITYSYASRFNILPIAVSGKKVTVATAEPFIREWERELSNLLKLDFKRVIANPLAVTRYLAEFYAISKSISRAEFDRSATPISSVGNFEQLVELGKTGEVDANDQHIVRIVDWLLQYAFDQRASDIHLEPRRETGNIRFRIDSILHLVNQIPTPVLTAAISRIKALGRMDVIERRRPQDGRIKTKTPSGKEVELRLSTMPSTFGEKMVMRIFDPDVLVKSFTDLGFSNHDRSLWTRMATQPHGIIVVTGPTGSGKTTTLYSTLKHLARPEMNICTIEDPVEMVDPDFNQMHVQKNIGVDFASGVRTILRQDPDIIMVGEIRDTETAETAIQAALTGHLVLTTLHTNDAPSTITRFLDLGIAPYLLRSALLGVVAQRLVRTLCPHCRAATEISADEWKSLVAPMRLRRPTKAYVPVGCEECRFTGYFGRIGIFEVLLMTEAIRNMVTNETDVAQLRDAALGEGMRSLRVSGAQKVQNGLTAAAEVFNVVQAEDGLL